VVPNVDNMRVVEVAQDVDLVHDCRRVLDKLLGDDPGE
jgi:hypothetical protein